MKRRLIGYSAGILATLLVSTPAAHAQDPASDLQDLVGARGSSGEQALQFMYEGKTYFYVSDPGAAEMEVKHFHGQ